MVKMSNLSQAEPSRPLKKKNNCFSLQSTRIFFCLQLELLFFKRSPSAEGASELESMKQVSVGHRLFGRRLPKFAPNEANRHVSSRPMKEAKSFHHHSENKNWLVFPFILVKRSQSHKSSVALALLSEINQ